MGTLKNFAAIFLIVVLIGILALAWELFAPFVTVILLAAIFTTVFYPTYLRTVKMVHSKNLASILMCLLVVICIILPIAGIIWLLALQSLDTYMFFEHKVLIGEFDTYIEWIGHHLPTEKLRDFYESFFVRENLDLIEKIAGTAQQVSGWLVEQGATLVSGTTTLVGNFFLMLFTMFYFFRDGKKFASRILHLSPLPSKYEKELFHKFYNASTSVIFGTFVMAIVQGIIGGIGFWLVGIQPFIWGVAMAFFSLVPVVGTAVIWVPAVVVLFFSGEPLAAFFLMAWGVFAIGMSDNLVRPYLMKGRMKIHPLIIFFSIIGGLTAFGFLGLLFGPLIIALTATMIHIYELEYAKVLNRGDHDE